MQNVCVVVDCADLELCYLQDPPFTEPVRVVYCAELELCYLQDLPFTGPAGTKVALPLGQHVDNAQEALLLVSASCQSGSRVLLPNDRDLDYPQSVPLLASV